MIDRTLYTAYFDPNADRSLPDKLAFAAGQYERKHGRQPTTALLHPADLSPFLPGVREVVGDYTLTLNTAPFVSPGTVYIGRPDTTEELTEMSTTTVEPTVENVKRVIRAAQDLKDDLAKQGIDVKLHAGTMTEEERLADEIQAKIEAQGITVRNGADRGVMPPSRDDSPETGKVSIATISVPYEATSTAEGIKREATIILPIPSEQAFYGADFLADPHLQRLADQLCATHDLPAEGAVTILWKRKGGRNHGKDALGKCTPTESGLLGYFAPAQFTVWIAADHARTHQLTPAQIEACVFHELLHVGEEVDEKTGEAKLIGVWEDVQAFRRELEVYGCWQDDLAQAKAYFEQARLWG